MAKRTSKKAAPKKASSPKSGRGKSKAAANSPLPTPHIVEQMMQEFVERTQDPVFDAQECAYEAMDAISNGDVERALELAVRACELDPNCVDAMHILAEMSSDSPEELIQELEMIVARAEQAMGKKFLKDNAGYFWGILETRPYMRVREELASVLYETGRIEEAIEHYEGMLHLNPNDNQGNRYTLLGCYLETGNEVGVKRLFKEYPDEGSAMFAWACVLAEVLANDEVAAKSALKKARQVNKHVEAYLTGRKRMPKEGPPYYSPGEPSEAIVCMYEIGDAWKKHSSAIQWLKKQGS